MWHSARAYLGEGFILYVKGLHRIYKSCHLSIPLSPSLLRAVHLNISLSNSLGTVDGVGAVRFGRELLFEPLELALGVELDGVAALSPVGGAAFTVFLLRKCEECINEMIKPERESKMSPDVRRIGKP